MGLRVPSIVTVHDLQPLLVPEFTGHRFFLLKRAYDIFYRWIYPRSIRNARWVTCDSHATKRDMWRLIPESRANSITIYPALEDGFAKSVEDNTIAEAQKKYELPERFIMYIGSTRPEQELAQHDRGVPYHAGTLRRRG